MRRKHHVGACIHSKSSTSSKQERSVPNGERSEANCPASGKRCSLVSQSPTQSRDIIMNQSHNKSNDAFIIRLPPHPPQHTNASTEGIASPDLTPSPESTRSLDLSGIVNTAIRSAVAAARKSAESANKARNIHTINTI